MARRFGMCCAAMILLAVGWGGAASAQAAPEAEGPSGVGATGLRGDWGGTYFCNQGLTGMTLRILEAAPRVRALYAFYPINENPNLPFGCYEMNGEFDPETGEIRLEGGRWLRRPEGWITVNLSGVADLSAQTLAGDVEGLSCTFFDLVKTEPSTRVDQSCQPELFALRR